MACHCVVGPGVAGQSWSGLARPGVAGRGWARSGLARQVRRGTQVRIGPGWRGISWRVKAGGYVQACPGAAEFGRLLSRHGLAGGDGRGWASFRRGMAGPVGRVVEWSGTVWRGRARSGRQGRSRRGRGGPAGPGAAGGECQGSVFWSRNVPVWQARLGAVGHGGPGAARLGSLGPADVWLGTAGQAWCGAARIGAARRGAAWCGRHGGGVARIGGVWHGKARLGRLVSACPGAAWLGGVRRGTVRHGVAGWARHGRVGHRPAGSGGVRQARIGPEQAGKNGGERAGLVGREPFRSSPSPAHRLCRSGALHCPDGPDPTLTPWQVGRGARSRVRRGVIRLRCGDDRAADHSGASAPRSDVSTSRGASVAAATSTPELRYTPPVHPRHAGGSEMDDPSIASGAQQPDPMAAEDSTSALREAIAARLLDHQEARSTHGSNPMRETASLTGLPESQLSKRCTAHSRNSGQQCRQPAVPGATVCRYHGGAAPQVRRKAALRLAALVEPALGVLASELVNVKGTPMSRLRAVENVLDRGAMPRKTEVSTEDARAALVDRLLELRTQAIAADAAAAAEAGLDAPGLDPADLPTPDGVAFGPDEPTV